MKRIVRWTTIFSMLLLLLPLAHSARAEDVIQISTPAQLIAVHDNLDGHYELACDIDMRNCYTFEPIGDEQSGPFTGTFDGKGHTIKNLDLDYNTFK